MVLYNLNSRQMMTLVAVKFVVKGTQLASIKRGDRCLGIVYVHSNNVE